MPPDDGTTTVNISDDPNGETPMPVSDTPPSSYTQVDHVSDTRQAQHSNANDAPADVNNNAVLARSQGLTVDVSGKGFVAGQERRQIIADRFMIPQT